MDRINYRENLSKENTIAAVKVPKVFVSLLHNKKKRFCSLDVNCTYIVHLLFLIKKKRYKCLTYILKLQPFLKRGVYKYIYYLDRGIIMGTKTLVASNFAE